MNIHRILFSASFLLLHVTGTSQEGKRSTSMSGDKSVSSFVRAIAAYKRAHAFAVRKADRTGSDRNAWMVGEAYRRIRRYDSAYAWYSRISPGFLQSNPAARNRVGELRAMRGDYKSALELLGDNAGDTERVQGFQNPSSLQTAQEAWTVEPVGAVNTPYTNEFSPLAWGEGLIWSSNIPASTGRNGMSGADGMGFARLRVVDRIPSLSASTGRDAQKSKPQSTKPLAAHHDLGDFPLLQPVPKIAGLSASARRIDSFSTELPGLEKAQYNNAHASFHAADSSLYLSMNRGGRRGHGIRHLGLARVKWQAGRLSAPEFLYAGNDTVSMLHPAISPDGGRLVFAMHNTSSGRTDLDLYVADRSAGGWSAPRLLQSVNTEGDEAFPRFTADGSLLFSSDGRAGFGGLDIYRCRLNGDKAEQVTLLPAPLNSSFDDFGVSLESDGRSGYFSSNRNGSDDIFRMRRK